MIEKEIVSRRSSVISTEMITKAVNNLRDKVVSSNGDFSTYTNKNAIKYIHDLKAIAILNEEKSNQKVYQTDKDLYNFVDKLNNLHPNTSMQYKLNVTTKYIHFRC